jgi:hypothetical protein
MTPLDLSRLTRQDSTMSAQDSLTFSRVVAVLDEHQRTYLAETSDGRAA